MYVIQYMIAEQKCSAWMNEWEENWEKERQTERKRDRNTITSRCINKASTDHPCRQRSCPVWRRWRHLCRRSAHLLVTSSWWRSSAARRSWCCSWTSPWRRCCRWKRCCQSHSVRVTWSTHEHNVHRPHTTISCSATTTTTSRSSSMRCACFPQLASS